MTADILFSRGRRRAYWLGRGIICLLFLSSQTMAGADAIPPEPAGLMDLNIEELRIVKIATVSGASRFEQKVTEAPSSVTLITADDIRMHGYRSLADILRSVTGFYATNDRNYSYVGIRGFGRPGDYNTRVLLLVDGHRINDNIYDQALLGLEFPLDVDLIERVEIIRGPGSALYGSNAFFGVISITTKNAKDMQGTEIAAAGGSLATKAGRISHGATLPSNGSLLLSGSAYNSQGNDHLYYPEFDSLTTNNGVADHKDGERYEQAFMKIALGGVTLSGAYGHREKDVPTGSWGTVFNDPANRSRDEHGYLDLSFRRGLSDRWALLARTYYDSFNYEQDYRIDYPPLTTNRDTAQGAWWGGEVQLSGRMTEKNRITIGCEYQDNIQQDQRNFDIDPTASYIDDARRSRLWGLYAQNEYRMLEKVLFNLGLRYDHYSTFGDTTNPRLALIYMPFEKTSFKLIHGTAFRAPNAYEMYYDDSTTSKGNPDLQPEKIKTSELIYEQYVGDHVRTSFSGFFYRIDGLITAATDPADGLQQFNNSGIIKAHGAEIEVEGSWSNGLLAKAGYSFQQAADEGGKVPTNSPTHMAKGSVTIPLLSKRLFIDPEVQFMSRRRTEAGNYADAFTITNLTILAPGLYRGVDASLSIYNLLDKRYGDPVAAAPQFAQDTIQQDGRVFLGKVTYSF